MRNRFFRAILPYNLQSLDETLENIEVKYFNKKSTGKQFVTACNTYKILLGYFRGEVVTSPSEQ